MQNVFEKILQDLSHKNVSITLSIAKIGFEPVCRIAQTALQHLEIRYKNLAIIIFTP